MIPAEVNTMLVPQRGLAAGDVLQPRRTPETGPFSFEVDSEGEHDEEDADLALLQVRAVRRQPSPREAADATERQTSPSGTTIPVEGGSTSTLPGYITPQVPQPADFDEPLREILEGGNAFAQRTDNLTDARPVLALPTRCSIPTPFGRRSLSAPDAGDRDKFRLETCLPPAQTKTGPGRLQLGINREMFDYVFGQYGLEIFRKDWRSIPDVPPSSRALLSRLPPLPAEAKPETLQLYVDGSFQAGARQPSHCGWSIVALALHQSQWCWLGWTAVGIQPTGDHTTLGTPVHSSFEPELGAICFALAICVRLKCLA